MDRPRSNLLRHNRTVVPNTYTDTRYAVPRLGKPIGSNRSETKPIKPRGRKENQQFPTVCYFNFICNRREHGCIPATGFVGIGETPFIVSDVRTSIVMAQPTQHGAILEDPPLGEAFCSGTSTGSIHTHTWNQTNLSQADHQPSPMGGGQQTSVLVYRLPRTLLLVVCFLLPFYGMAMTREYS